jgi:SAM-dependent methyltransferase
MLLDVVRCPSCAAAVDIDGEAVCSAGHRFPVVDGVIVMVDDDAVEAKTQYVSQRAYFDAEFETPERGLPNWRLSYLRRLREAGALAGPLVDVGVGGSGYTVIEAARAGADAVGCDLSLTGVAAARQRAIAEGVVDSTLWICCSAERLPLATASFSSALAIAVLEHVPDDVAMLSELARVLRPGGKAWVTVPHALRHIASWFRLPNRMHDRRLGHLRRYEAEELIAAGESVGLIADDVQFTGHPVKVLQLLAGRASDSLWWWCERRDLARRDAPRGSMQLSLSFTRSS